MKKLLCALTAVFLLATGCKRDFIELYPISNVTIDDLYKTDKDFQDAVTGCYNVFQSEYQNFYMYGDMRSDDTWKEVSRNVSSFFFSNFTVDPNDTQLGNTWRNYYRIINRANTILYFIENTDQATVPNKERHIGEARFLRALAYFNLVRIFGDVPAVTVPITAQEAMKVRREKVDVIYDEIIIKDLIEAEGKLPPSYSGPDVGRASRGAAKALLGKVYLTVKDFGKAESKLAEVTTMGYALLPNYNALWNYTVSEHHSEYIFDIEYESGGVGEGSVFTNAFIPLSAPFNTFYRLVGQTREDNNPTQGLLNAFQPGDLRKDITVDGTGGFVNAAGVFVPFLQTSTYTKKYITPIAIANDSPANWKVIRYADVLLMYAEALNENGKTPEALTYLNQVRNRAGLDGWSGLTRDEARERIYEERRLELACEGHRWFDLVRTGRALAALEGNGMRPYMTLFPVPLLQIQVVNDLNVMWQNEGY